MLRIFFIVIRALWVDFQSADRRESYHGAAEEREHKSIRPIGWWINVRLHLIVYTLPDVHGYITKRPQRVPRVAFDPLSNFG
mmetsp:Transcript_18506/g.41496  ORF Transcript_18506/g.41496 Transcript_18506/m.41496 type:complete len:82 (-) Transcript_18506:689-934(-)